MSSVQEKETSNSLYRQWQILSRLSTGKWMGTRELQEILEREGIDISLRTIQRDLNQIAQRFPIESNKTVHGTMIEKLTFSHGIFPFFWCLVY